MKHHHCALGLICCIDMLSPGDTAAGDRASPDRAVRRVLALLLR